MFNLLEELDKTIIGKGDGYKYSHHAQYPSGVINQNSYMESRGVNPGFIPNKDPEVVFFGLQAFIREYLSTPLTKEMVDFAEKIIKPFCGSFHREGWMKIVNDHDGYLPVIIEAVPEGTCLKTKNVLLQVRATHPEFVWLASFVETALLRSIWYPTTVATLSREIKKAILKYSTETVDDDRIEDDILFKLNDFGARGVSSHESAGIGGLAHLINFVGTDTVESIFAGMKYYDVDTGDGIAGSIPASEHSTMTMWGRDGEVDAFENMIDLYSDHGIFACVSDSYDIWDAVDNKWSKILKDKVLASGARLIVRPDSGHPVETPVKVIEILAKEENFGYYLNSKGYKVLNDSVRVIQGDGIDIFDLIKILESLKEKGFSSENINFGMGGGLLQRVNRDDLKFACKTSAALDKNNEWFDVYKQPVGMAWKQSKKGILKLVKIDNEFKTVRQDDPDYEFEENFLRPVWSEGVLYVNEDFDTIKKRAKI